MARRVKEEGSLFQDQFEPYKNLVHRIGLIYSQWKWGVPLDKVPQYQLRSEEDWNLRGSPYDLFASSPAGYLPDYDLVGMNLTSINGMIKRIKSHDPTPESALLSYLITHEGVIHANVATVKLEKEEGKELARTTTNIFNEGNPREREIINRLNSPDIEAVIRGFRIGFIHEGKEIVRLGESIDEIFATLLTLPIASLCLFTGEMDPNQAFNKGIRFFTEHVGVINEKVTEEGLLQGTNWFTQVDKVSVVTAYINGSILDKSVFRTQEKLYRVGQYYFYDESDNFFRNIELE